MTGIEQLNAGNYQDAIDSFGKALDESDGIVNSFELDVLKYRGEAEYKLADYKAAAQTYGILAEVDGGKAEYLYYKAASEAAAGQAEDAEKFCGSGGKGEEQQKSSAEAPGVSLAFTALASAAQDAGDSELAAQYCNQAIERGVSGPEIYNQLAISEMEAGDYESAMSHYEEALSLADSETALVIRQNIAVLYEKEGDFAKALEQFKECRAAGADTPEVQKENPFSGKPVNIGGNMAELFDMKELEERVITVAVSTSDEDDTEASLDELEELADTAGAAGDRASRAEPGEDSSRHLSGQWKDRGTAGDGLGNGRNRRDLRR